MKSAAARGGARAAGVGTFKSVSNAHEITSSTFLASSRRRARDEAAVPLPIRLVRMAATGSRLSQNKASTSLRPPRARHVGEEDSSSVRKCACKPRNLIHHPDEPDGVTRVSVKSGLAGNLEFHPGKPHGDSRSVSHHSPSPHSGDGSERGQENGKVISRAFTPCFRAAAFGTVGNRSGTCRKRRSRQASALGTTVFGIARWPAAVPR